MASFVGFARRNWTFLNPPNPGKLDGALRVGLLGASNIAPMAIISPAKSHPEVIIVAVAARDSQRAAVYAKKYGIPIVHSSYQELIDDPSITVIYNPLPNGLHYEWTLKALRVGKHVLLEKPSVSNSQEANLLFHHALLSQPNAPVILEAFHARFHPAWQKFLTLLSPKTIISASFSGTLAKYIFPITDIRFKYDLSGGAMMDFGTYGCMFLREMFGGNPVECIEAKPRLVQDGGDQLCDEAFEATWRWENGGTGTVDIDLRHSTSLGVPWMGLPIAEATHQEAIVDDDKSGAGNEHIVVKKIVLRNPVGPSIWHRIDIINEHSIRDIQTKNIVKNWTTKEYRKAYTWDDELGRNGEVWWSTYRHQLEVFVDKVKGRPNDLWIDGEYSIRQMSMVDSAYEKAGMKMRPSSSFRLE